MTEWSGLAMGVLSECFSNNTDKSRALLLRKLPNWGNTDCLTIAVNAHNKEFISHPACQMLLDGLWKGNLNQNLSMFRIVMCVFCPFLIIPMTKPTDVEARGAAGSSKYAGGANADRKTYEIEPNGVRPHQSGDHGTESAGVKEKGSARSRKDADAANDDLEKDETKSASGKHSKANEQRQISTKQIIALQMRQIQNFFTAPVTIFLYNLVSYMVFLSLYTYLILFSFGPKVSTEEIILIIWVCTLCTEEVRQVVAFPKLRDYITDLWNIVDITSLLLFIIGVILRFLPNDKTLEAGRVILSLNIVMFCVRLLHIFSVHKTLGPKLVMIRKMVKDLIHFVVIMSLFLVSYAIASHAILYPNSPLTWITVVKVLRKPCWNMFGVLFLNEIEGEETCTNDITLWNNDTFPRCPSEVGKIVVPLMMGVYVLLTNVLFINLLIAMCSYTFTEVQKNTYKHWCFQRFALINEYQTRSVLPPPLISFVHLIKFIKWFYKHISCESRGQKVSPSTPNKSDQPEEQNGEPIENNSPKKHNKSHKKNKSPKQNESKRTEQSTDIKNEYDEMKNIFNLIAWEKIMADRYIQKQKQQELGNTRVTNTRTTETMKTLTNRIDQLHEKLQYWSTRTTRRLVKLEVNGKEPAFSQRVPIKSVPMADHGTILY